MSDKKVVKMVIDDSIAIYVDGGIVMNSMDPDIDTILQVLSGPLGFEFELEETYNEV